MDTVARMPYCAMQRQLDVSYPKGQRHYWKSAFLKSVTDDVIDLMIETVSTAPSPFNSIVLEAYGGAVARVANDARHSDTAMRCSILLILAISDDEQSTRNRRRGDEMFGRRFFRTHRRLIRQLPVGGRGRAFGLSRRALPAPCGD